MANGDLRPMTNGIDTINNAFDIGGGYGFKALIRGPTSVLTNKYDLGGITAYLTSNIV